MRKLGFVLLLFFFLVTLVILLAGCLPKDKNLPIQKGGEEEMGVLTGKKVVMILAPKDFRDEEFFKSRVSLQAGGAQVIIASRGVEEATGMLGGKAKIDLDINKVKIEEYDAVVFVGGAGSEIYFADKTALRLAQEAVAQDKVVGAICIAPSILANAGVLQGKKVTSWTSEKDNLQEKGATYTGSGIEVDGKIVTAQGPQNAEEFGKKLAEILGE